MGQIEGDGDDIDIEDWDRQEEEHALSPTGIAEQNEHMLRRYREFRFAADAVAAAWRNRPELAAVALIGSVATAPRKEIPRFSAYRRAGVALWHECKDVDLAVWLTHLRDLDGLRRTKDKALRELYEARAAGVASHQMDVFVFDPGTDRYLGRLCQFNRCPKGKTECLVPGCGATQFLRQHEDFQLRPESLAADRVVGLFNRATGRFNRAADLPLPTSNDDPDDQRA